MNFKLKFLRPVVAALFCFILLFGYVGALLPQQEVQAAASVELTSLRTENSKTFDLGNGKYRIDSSIGLLHYKDNYANSNEQWKDIDTSIVNGRIDKAPYTAVFDYANKTVTVLDKKTGSVTTIGMQSLGGVSLLGKGSASIVRNTATWSNVAIDTDIKIIASNSVIRLQRVLKSANANTQAVFNVSQSGTGIEIVYKASDLKQRIDSSIPMVVSLDKGILTEDIDKTKAGTITYPLVIDPTLDIKVAASHDSVYCYGTTLAHEDIYIGEVSGTTNFASTGVRFLNVTVPKNSTIDAAYITFTAHANCAGTTCNATVYADDADNAGTFSTAADYYGRTRTTANASWANIGAWTVDTTTNAQSPSLATVVKEIVDRASWASGNAMAFLFDSTTGTAIAYRRGYAYDNGDASNYPVLHIEYTAPVITCALTGTITTATESNIVLGGKTIILTLTGDTWVAAGATFNAQRDDIIAGMDSAQSEAGGWDAKYKANAATYVADVVRTSDTVVTVTMSALGTYAITANETITVTVPATALTGAGAIVASPTFVITHLDWACALGGTITAATTEIDITTGGKVITLTLTDATWAVAAGGLFDAQRQNIINGLISSGAEAHGWNVEVKAKMAVGEVVRTNDTVVTITLAAQAGYNISAQETITATVPSTAINIGIAIVATPTFTVDALAPVISTVAASSITGVTATLNGTVDDLKGGGNVTIHGFGWDVHTHALWSDYANNPHTHSSIGVSAFNEPIAGLTSGTKYYFRAYGTSPLDTSQGSELTFLTLPDPPTAFTATATSDVQINLAWTKAVCGAGVTVNTYVRANLGSAPTFSGAGGTTIYNSTLAVYNHAGLTTGQHWFYRVWTRAVEGALEQYSATYAEYDATTFVAPTVTTGICSGSGTTWAILNGNVTATGIPTTVTQRGFEYGLTTGYGSLAMNAGSFGTGTYFSSLAGLSPSTVYHYRAAATNGAWGYGADAIFATKGSPAITTYFNTGDDTQTDIYGVNVAAQTFTTSATTEYTVTSVRLKILRVLSPGTITVSIRRATAGAGNEPTGANLASGTINGNTIGTAATWYDIPMTTETTLELNSTYCIVVSAASGDAANYVRWCRVAAGGFAGGNADTSANSGITWAVQTYDFLFELWGNQALEIQDAKVFQSYKDVGDWLVTVRYVNVYAPYYPTYDVRKYFAIQLVDSTGVAKASQPCSAWGNRVGSVYISAAAVTPLTYGGTYKVRIQGTFTGTPYTEYSLLATDWVGDDLTNLDSWATTSANIMNTHDTLLNSATKAYTTSIATRGTVLTATGGDILSQGIPGLTTVRPQIFQIYTTNTTYTPATGTATMANTVRSGTAAAIGPDAVVAFGQFGQNVMGGLAYNQVIALLAVIIAFGLAACTFPFGHTTAANVLCVGVLFAFSYFGFDWIWIGMIYAVSVFLLAKKLWIDTGI